MAFQPAANPAPTGGRPSNRGEFEKAVGFINLYLPTKGGQRRKLGTIALNASVVVQKQVFELLQADPDNLQKLLAKLDVEFNPQIDDTDPNNALDI